MKQYIITGIEPDLGSVKTPQVHQLARILAKHRNTTHDHETLPVILQDPELKTRQDPYLIFKYYQRDLIQLGILRIESIKTESVKPRGTNYWNYEGVEAIPAVVEVLEVVE